jgi:ABC-2 type transport system ATP-binding protein
VTDAPPRAVSIEATGLGRSYDGRWAVRGLDLRIHAGEIYGFLGPNGAGKTTTIRMLAGLLRPTEGDVRIGGLTYGEQPRQIKQALGLVPDTPPLYEYLSGRQYIALVGSLWNVDSQRREQRMAELLTALDLDDVADDLCKSYSHGTRKKVHLAAVLTTEPEVLLLDEPTTGLDPRSTKAMKDLLHEQADRGTAILFSTHMLDAAEQLCSRVGILYRGQLVDEGPPRELRDQVGADSLEDLFLKLTADHPADGDVATRS